MIHITRLMYCATDHIIIRCCISMIMHIALLFQDKRKALLDRFYTNFDAQACGHPQT